MILSNRPVWQELDGNGRPYAGGLLYTYESGTTIPKSTYDKDGNTNANPVQFDSEGRATIRLGSGQYSMTFSDGVGASVLDPLVIEGVVVWAVDDVGYSGASGSLMVVDSIAALIALDANEADLVVVRGNAGGTFYWDATSTASDGGVIVRPVSEPAMGRWVRQFNGDVNPRWWGAVLNGTTPDNTALAAAKTYALANGTGIVLDYGTLLLTANPELGTIRVTFNKAKIKWTGFALTINPIIPISDIDRHFEFSTVSDTPVFNADADIRNAWIDGTTGWYQSSINASVTALDGRVTAIEDEIGAIGDSGTILNNVKVNTDDIATLEGRASVLESDVATLQTYGAGTVETGFFPVGIYGFSSVSSILQMWMYKKETLGGYVVASLGTWTSGSISVTVTCNGNSTVYSQSFVTSIVNSLGLLNTQIAANTNIRSSVYDGGVGITITPNSGVVLGLATSTVARVGTMTLSSNVNNIVSISVPAIDETGDTGNKMYCLSASLPSSIRPLMGCWVPCTLINTEVVSGAIYINSSGFIYFFLRNSADTGYSETLFTDSARRGINPIVITYPINPNV